MSHLEKYVTSHAEAQRAYDDRVQSGKDRGKLPYDYNLKRFVDEYGKPPERVKFDRKREHLLGGVKLTNDNWTRLMTKIDEIEKYYNQSKESDITDKQKKNFENIAKQKLKDFRTTVDNHIGKSTDDHDYRYLDKLNEHLPNNIDENQFTESISMCRNYIADGRK